MVQSLTQNAIALLIDLAEQGEIDPWDVQVIEVVDRFFQELPLSLGNSRGDFAYEAELSHSGQAFVYASMLILLKADSLVRLETVEDGETEPLEEPWPDATVVDFSLPRNLERHLRRRAVAHPPAHRPVTLQELIQQLEVMAIALEDKPQRPRPRRSRSQSRTKMAQAIAELAHQENLVEVAAQLEHLLGHSWHHLTSETEWLGFETLLEFWSQFQHQDGSLGVRSAPMESMERDAKTQTNAQINTQIEDAKKHSPKILSEDLSADGHSTPGHSLGHSTELLKGEFQGRDPVGVFWALLLLSAQSKVELHQDEFYQDLKIRRLEPLPQSIPSQTPA